MMMSKHDVHYSSERMTWGTPKHLYSELHRRYQFDLDVAACAANALCPRYYQEGGGGKSAGDGLSAPWDDARVWCNPPYGREIGHWVDKANREAEHAQLIVMLVPARTDTLWWHRAIAKARPVFLKGRLKFEGAKSSAPFPSALLVWNV